MLKLIIICIVLQTILASYNNSVGLKYLHFAKATYCEEQQILDWDCEACLYNEGIVNRFVITNSKFESLSFIGLNKKEKEIVVAFRGSDNFRNWLTNLNFVKKSYDGCVNCSIHRGFLNSWEGQKELITNRVNLLLEANPGFDVNIVGHSLGGAIATVCAMELTQDGIKINKLITYGAPRVGDQNLADYIERIIPNATRIVRRKDPVPHVPPRSMGFRHFGAEHFYDNLDDEFEFESCQTIEPKTCSNTYLVIQTALSVSDHLNYLGRSTQCSEKLSMQNEEQNINLKSSQNNEQFEGFGDFSEEYLRELDHHIVDLDDEVSTYDWTIRVDDNDIDYLVLID